MSYNNFLLLKKKQKRRSSEDGTLCKRSMGDCISNTINCHFLSIANYALNNNSTFDIDRNI